MKALSTSDIQLEMLRELREDLAPDVAFEVDDRQIFLRSVDAPSWVSFLAESPWWIKMLAAYSAVYVAEIVREAAKDTWKSRAKAVAAVRGAGNRLWRLAEGIKGLRKRLPGRTRIEVGLPFPEEYFATCLELSGSTVEEIALQLALFVHHLPGLEALISSQSLDRDRVAGGMRLRLLGDGSLAVSWQDGQTLEVRQQVLRIGDPT